MMSAEQDPPQTTIQCAEPGCPNVAGAWLPLGWAAYCRAHVPATKPPLALSWPPALPLPGDPATRLARIERALALLASHPWVDKHVRETIDVSLTWEPSPGEPVQR
jgi:hypothetical protein